MAETLDLLPERFLQDTYRDAANQMNRESTTVFFAENFFNYFLAYPSGYLLTVNSQHPVDDSTCAVDLAVNFHSSTDIGRRLLMLIECKRKKSSSNGKLMSLEDQLVGYAERCLNPVEGGLAKTNRLWAIACHGTKFRAFHCERVAVSKGVNDVHINPIWGGSMDKNLGEGYRDPGSKADVQPIRVLLSEIRQSVGLGAVNLQDGQSMKPLVVPQAIPQQSQFTSPYTKQPLALMQASSSASAAPSWVTPKWYKSPNGEEAYEVTIDSKSLRGWRREWVEKEYSPGQYGLYHGVNKWWARMTPKK
ncbi:MAG: hypothetical protein L6R38_006731 [Xanthoria sp. 2 TBL-2021]|nr:MAG: hypothetical protein L6R38_006731 [Xanthoria sp. 2 TBL-2021]